MQNQIRCWNIFKNDFPSIFCTPIMTPEFHFYVEYHISQCNYSRLFCEMVLHLSTSPKILILLPFYRKKDKTWSFTILKCVKSRVLDVVIGP